jgi:hypothetical protein
VDEVEQEIIADDPADEERDSIAPKRAGDISVPEAETKSNWNPFPKKIKRSDIEPASTGEVAPATEPKKRGRPPGSGAGAKRGRPPKPSTQRKQALEAMFAMMGVAVTPFNAYDGAVILQNGGQLSASLCKLADEDERVAKMLDSLLTASTWSQVAMGFAAVGVPIMANHKLAPENLVPLFGCPTPTAFKEERRAELEALGL